VHSKKIQTQHEDQSPVKGAKAAGIIK